MILDNLIYPKCLLSRSAYISRWLVDIKTTQNAHTQFNFRKKLTHGRTDWMVSQSTLFHVTTIYCQWQMVATTWVCIYFWLWQEQLSTIYGNTTDLHWFIRSWWDVHCTHSARNLKCVYTRMYKYESQTMPQSNMKDEREFAIFSFVFKQNKKVSIVFLFCFSNCERACWTIERLMP